jgi:hypothetical protein
MIEIIFHFHVFFERFLPDFRLAQPFVVSRPAPGDQRATPRKRFPGNFHNRNIFFLTIGMNMLYSILGLYYSVVPEIVLRARENHFQEACDEAICVR